MSGRGCTITVKVLGGSSDNDGIEELRLPVALHSPLEILKAQLEDIVGITFENQGTSEYSIIIVFFIDFLYL